MIDHIRRHRGILAGVLLVALAASGLATAAYLLVVPLPHPRDTNRDQLARWLVLRDLAAEPADVQRALVDRLQEELIAGIDISAADDSLGEEYRRRLMENIDVLRGVWFEYRVEQYAAMPQEQRHGFLEQQIEVIDRWSALQAELATGADGSPSQASAASPFFDEIEGWIENAAGQQREQMIAAVRDGVVCWLATRDLAEQSPALRRDLALRIAREFQAGLVVGDAASRQTAGQQQRLAANGKLLVEAWLYEQAELYADLEDSERTQFLDAKMDAILSWGVADFFSQQSANGESETASGIGTLLKEVDVWISRADPQTQPELKRLVNDFRARIVWRQLKTLLPKW